MFLPIQQVENMRLSYDNETRKTSNTEGVNVIVPGFGTTDSIGKVCCFVFA